MAHSTYRIYLLPSRRRAVRSRSLPVLAACLWSVVLTAGVQAEVVVFDNFGAGDSYDTGDVWAFRAGETDLDLAMSFTPSQGGPLSDVWFVTCLLVGDNELDVWVMNDTDGHPGSVLESWHFSGAMGAWGEIIPPTHPVGDGTTLLAAGTQYWLAVSATGPDAYAGWYWNDTGDVGTVASRTDLGNWNTLADVTRGAFRVAVVPEPTTLSFLGLASLGMIRRRRRRG